MEIVCLTRFNLEIPSFYEGGEKICLNEDYLQNRFEIFEKYTLPSIISQTKTDFSWIVMFHEDTLPKFREKIDSFVERCPQMIPWFLSAEDGNKYVLRVSEYLKDRFPQKKVITIRLDNDDIISKYFLEESEKHFSTPDSSVILSYMNGLQYDMERKYLIRYRYPSNHFLAMAKTTDDENNNILCFDHSLIADYFSKDEICFEDNPSAMWVEIISGTNVINSMNWSFKGIKVSEKVSDSFPMISLPWNGILEKMAYYLSAFGKACVFKLVSFRRRLLRKLCK